MTELLASKWQRTNMSGFYKSDLLNTITTAMYIVHMKSNSKANLHLCAVNGRIILTINCIIKPSIFNHAVF